MKMKLLKPFSAYRYSDAFKEKMSCVICPPYDIINGEKQMELFKNPYNYVRVVLSPLGHDKAAETIKKFISDGTFVREEREKIYILKQRFKVGRSESEAIGIIALLSLSARILAHEQTKSNITQDRIGLLDKTGFNTCPIMLFAKNTNIRKWTENLRTEKLFDFSYQSDDLGTEVYGELYSSDDLSVLNELEKTYFFIADGHHRFEAIREVYSRKNEEYFMAYITDENSGTIMFPIARKLKNDITDRLVKFSKNLQSIEVENITGIEEWMKLFDDEEMDCIVLTKDKALKVSLSKNPEEDAINFIHDYLIGNLEVTFEHSIIKIIESMRRKEIECSIIPKVPSIQEIWETVEKGKILPPKSTYFWPKVPSGLLLNKTGFSEL